MRGLAPQLLSFSRELTQCTSAVVFFLANSAIPPPLLSVRLLDPSSRWICCCRRPLWLPLRCHRCYRCCPLLQLTCVHLIDSHHCSDPSKFLSVLLLSLNSMIQLELPHVNVLSKMDLIESLGPLEFGLEFYTDVLDLSYLLPRLREQAGGASHPLSRKFARLNKAMADLIESYNLVSFLPFAVDDLELLQQVLKVADKANGALYVPVADRSTGEGAKGSTTKDAASAAAGTAAATAASSSSSAATAAALRQRHHLLNSVDTSQLHDLHLSVAMHARTHCTHPPLLRRPSSSHQSVSDLCPASCLCVC